MSEQQNNGYEEERQRLSEKKPPCRTKLQRVKDWLDGDTSYCRPCIMPVPIDWYQQELRERGQGDLADELERARMTEDPATVAQVMDSIKEKVNHDTRYRLMEFDCYTQEFAAEEDGVILPDEASPESSPPAPHSLNSEPESPPKTSPPELPATEQ